MRTCCGVSLSGPFISLFTLRAEITNNNNNILYSSQREIKAVVRSHNEEHISIILSHETHAHTHI